MRGRPERRPRKRGFVLGWLVSGPEANVPVEDGWMAEPMENPVIVIPVQFVSLNLGHPAAGHRSPGSDGRN